MYLCTLIIQLQAIMKSTLSGILTFVVILLIITSCVSIDPTTDYSAWKKLNDSYFTNMKDSTGYTLYTIPASSGGSSFYYNVTTPGDPKSMSPLATDKVTVDYRGQLITGYIFDQNYSGTVIPPDSVATPNTFYANQLVRGWTANLIQMKVGETRDIILPQELGYGSIGAGFISPYSTTVWTVHLIKVIH